MASRKSKIASVGAKAKRFEYSKPKVYRYVFGEDGEFGTFTFRRSGDDAELIESIEPEFEAKAAEEAAQSSGSVTEEPAGSR